MLAAMERVGTSIRQKYNWVSMNDFFYLVMDNAGGHGTGDAITEYTNRLKDVYNI